MARFFNRQTCAVLLAGVLACFVPASNVGAVCNPAPGKETELVTFTVTDANNTANNAVVTSASPSSNPGKLYICGDTATIGMAATVTAGAMGPPPSTPSAEYVGWRIEKASGKGTGELVPPWPGGNARPSEGNAYAGCLLGESTITALAGGGSGPTVREFYVKPFCDGNRNCLKDPGEDYYYDTDGKVIEVQVVVLKVDLDADLDRDGDYDDHDDPEEHSDAGVLVFVNRDDDDGNSTEDHADPGASTENDLIELRLTGEPALLTQGKVVLEATAGKERIKVWTSGQKGSGNLLFDSATGKKEWSIGSGPTFDLANLGALPTPVHVEGMQKSTSAGDVVLELRYESAGTTVHKDTVALTVLTGDDIILYEPVQPANEAYIYPTLAAKRTLLFFHDAPTTGNELTGTASLRLKCTSTAVLQYRYDRLAPSVTLDVANGTFAGAPVNDALTYHNDSEGDTDPDMRVKCGIDYDKDGNLDDNEMMEEFNLLLVTDDNYRDALWEFEYPILLGSTKMADAIYRRFSTGTFAGTDPDYIPVAMGTIAVRGRANPTVAVSRHRFTHNVGAVFSGTGQSAVANNVPLFEYVLGSKGANLIADQLGYRHNSLIAGGPSGVETFMDTADAFNYGNIHARFNDAGGGPVGTKYANITFSDLTVPMLLDFNETGLGGCHAIGSITFSIERMDTARYRLADVSCALTIEDLCDFAFFGGLGAGDTLGVVQTAVSVQSGFGKCGNPAGVGESFVTRTITSQTFDSSLPLNPKSKIIIDKVP